MKAILISAVFLGAWPALASAQSWSVQSVGGDPTLHILCDGELVTKYHYQDVPRPFFYPVIGASGEPMTRGYPMDPHEDEATDHPHHRSLWFAHLDVNGVNFWSEPRSYRKNPPEGAKFGTIVHTGFSSMQAGSDKLVLTAKNDWKGPDEEVICQDERIYTFSKADDGSIRFDWDITISASQGDVVFGDDKDGTMAIRTIPSLRLVAVEDRKKPGTGHILTSEGIEDAEAWGSRAAWVTYYGPDRKGNPVGIAIFDHPENLRHPTWWHARNYGLFTANPFGIHHFEKKEDGVGNYRIAKGESLRQRYRILFYAGAPADHDLPGRYEAWAKK